MSRRLLRPAVAAALAGATLLALSACAPAADDAAPTPAAPVVSSSPTPIPTITQTAPAVRIPADCRSMLSADVLAQLGQTPLNDPALGPSGVQSDGSLICIWRDPAADTTGLVTHISRMDRGPALDMLNGLVDTQGFSCYTPTRGRAARRPGSTRPTPSTTVGRFTGATAC